MPAVIPSVRRPGGFEDQAYPGDSILSTKVFSQITTVGNGTLTGAAIAGGLIRRTGPTAAYTDTFDTSQNILTALRGNSPLPETMVGLSAELYIANGVAFAATIAAGRGVVLGTQGGATSPIAASGIMEYLLTIKNDTPEITMSCNIAPTGTSVLFALPPGMTAFKMGPAPDAVLVTPGMAMTGTGVSAGTTVTGLILGQGGITGVRTSANVNAGTNISIIFSPVIEVNNVGN
jgi:hypothetical protein